MFVNDIDIGDVVIHSRDDQSGIGVGEGHLLFTAPATGTYRIVLDVWIGREIGRSVNWTLSVDGAQADTGNVSSGDGFSRASPDGHSTSVALEAGDQVDLLLTSQSSAGDFVGIELRLEAFGIDVDGDGEVGPLTDGLLILRRLFGFHRQFAGDRRGGPRQLHALRRDGDRRVLRLDERAVSRRCPASPRADSDGRW